MTLGQSIESELTDLLRLLREYGVGYATVIDDLVGEVRQMPNSKVPPVLVDRLRALFGGIGTLNDVWISRANGDDVEDEELANRELEAVRSKLWQAVSKL